jgi:hypothetical protein
MSSHYIFETFLYLEKIFIGWALLLPCRFDNTAKAELALMFEMTCAGTPLCAVHFFFQSWLCHGSALVVEFIPHVSALTLWSSSGLSVIRFWGDH